MIAEEIETVAICNPDKGAASELGRIGRMPSTIITELIKFSTDLGENSGKHFLVASTIDFIRRRCDFECGNPNSSSSPAWELTNLVKPNGKMNLMSALRLPVIVYRRGQCPVFWKKQKLSENDKKKIE